MKKLLMGIIITTTIIILTSVNSNALIIEKFNLINYEYTNEELSVELQKSVVEEVYNDLKQDWLKDVPLQIIYAEKKIKRIKGCVFKSEDIYYIIMSENSHDKDKIAQTFLHEVGHVVQGYHKISDEIVAAFLGEKVNKNKWYDRTSEKFAEHFKYWYMKKHYNQMFLRYLSKYDRLIHTNGGYNRNFDILMWIW